MIGVISLKVIFPFRVRSRLHAHFFQRAKDRLCAMAHEIHLEIYLLSCAYHFNYNTLFLQTGATRLAGEHSPLAGKMQRK